MTLHHNHNIVDLRHIRWRSVVAVFQVCAIVAAGAHLSVTVETNAEAAPNLSKKEESQFKELVNRGLDSLEARRFADALRDLNDAYAMKQDWIVLYNLGRANEGLGNYPDALAQLEKFINEAPKEIRARAPGLEGLISELKTKISTLNLTCDVAGALVLIRQKLVGKTPLPTGYKVSAGKATIEVTADGYLPYKKEVDLPGGGSVTIDAALIPKGRVGILVVKTSDPGAEIFVDDKKAGAPPAEVSLLDGTHTIVVRFPNGKEAQTTAVVEAGKRKEISVSPDAAHSGSILGKWWFWTGVGVVVVGAGVGTYFAVTTERASGKGTMNPGVVQPLGFRFLADEHQFDSPSGAPCMCVVEFLSHADADNVGGRNGRARGV